ERTKLDETLKRYSIECLFYMVHLDTAPSVLLRGILSYNRARSILHTSIADEGVEARRGPKSFRLGKSNEHISINLHNYVPLYFATHTPMQYRITKGTRDEVPTVRSLEKLVFIVVDSKKVFLTPGVYFT